MLPLTTSPMLVLGSREAADRLEGRSVIRVHTSIEIQRPIAEVFAFMTDLDSAPSWTVGLVEVRHDGPLRKGATGTDIRRIGRKLAEMPWQVMEYDPPHVVTFTYSEPFAATATFSFEPSATGTQVTCDSELHLRGVYRLLAPLLARDARRTDARQFHNAKHALEARNSQHPGRLTDR